VTLIKEIVADNSVVVADLTGDACEIWDAYVRSAKVGLPLHLSGWRHVLQNTYGYETRYLFAQSAHNIVGVLPLFLLPSRLTGKRAMTMPGGVCADDEQIAHSLIERGMQLACEESVKRLLIQDSRRPFSNRLRSESQHVYWLLDLPSTEEELWQRLAGNIRRQVRKAKRNGLEVEVGRSEKHLGPFYEIFSQFTHQAGTPVFSQAFLKHVVDTFPDGFNIAIVRHEQQAIAGYFRPAGYPPLASRLLGPLGNHARRHKQRLFASGYGPQPCGGQLLEVQRTMGRDFSPNLSDNCTERWTG
jgi:hypothetical protein